ncbi:hypothetical protein PO909_025199, partial [Leuciscus waleckii]
CKIKCYPVFLLYYLNVSLAFVGVLLLLSLLQSTQSASTASTKVGESIDVTKMEELGKEALKHLVSSASSVLRNRTGSHSVGCIREPKEHERLNCTLLSTFISYLQTASGLGVDNKLRDMLEFIRERVKYRKETRCSGSSENTCETIFQKHKRHYKNLENVRSVLELYIQWIVKPME